MERETHNILNQDDLLPYTLTKGGGLIVFSGPHNGHAVPSALKPCMGMCPDWFKKAHEAADLNVATLFESLKTKINDANYIAGNYSRLVCDLNAMPDYAITRISPENADIKIPENQADSCCAEQRIRRIEEIYWPYHDAKKRLIQETRARHKGAIVLDLHSFTPTWAQKKRDVEIGTIRCEKTPLSRALEEYLKEQNHYHFVSGEPYRVAERPSNAAPLISDYNDLQYLGIEIRNDLIEAPDGVEKMTNFLAICLDKLLNHKNLDTITAPRSQINIEQKTTRPQAGWSI